MREADAGSAERLRADGSVVSRYFRHVRDDWFWRNSHGVLRKGKGTERGIGGPGQAKRSHRAHAEEATGVVLAPGQPLVLVLRDRERGVLPVRGRDLSVAGAAVRAPGWAELPAGDGGGVSLLLLGLLLDLNI